MRFSRPADPGTAHNATALRDVNEFVGNGGFVGRGLREHDVFAIRGGPKSTAPACIHLIVAR
jgi:hypothetical protein